MDIKLKKSLYKTLHDEYEKNKENYDTISDIFNLIKIIENYEKFTPDIKRMLNEKAREDKWKNCNNIDKDEK